MLARAIRGEGVEWQPDQLRRSQRWETVHIRGSGYLGLRRECASEGGAWKMTSEGRQESGMER